MKNLPDRIYLQIDADGETPEDFKELSGVTWCTERIYPTDIEYILNGEIRESCGVSCGNCKYVLQEGRCGHPQGCEGDYELWEQGTQERTE